MPQPAAASAAKFPTTQWTDLLVLREVADSAAQAKQQHVLRQLCQSYWFPLYAFARHRGMQQQDAEDAVQSFFLATWDGDFLLKADQEKGKFRTFLLTAFTRAISSHNTFLKAQKRGGDAVHYSIDAEQAEAWLLADPHSNHEDATLAFERHWAKNIIRTVIAKLEAESGATPKTLERFKILSRFLTPENCLGYSIADAAAELGMTRAACEKGVQRLRQQFRTAVRFEVARTLQNPDEDQITEEMTQLQKALMASD